MLILDTHCFFLLVSAIFIPYIWLSFNCNIQLQQRNNVFQLCLQQSVLSTYTELSKADLQLEGDKITVCGTYTCLNLEKACIHGTCVCVHVCSHAGEPGTECWQLAQWLDHGLIMEWIGPLKEGPWGTCSCPWTSVHCVNVRVCVFIPLQDGSD